MKKEEIYAMTLFNFLVNTSDHLSKLIRRSWGGVVGIAMATLVVV